MSFTQLEPPLPVHVIGKGEGYALAVIDYGQEHNLIWVTGLSESGEIWCAPNPLVRLQTNWSMGRKIAKPQDREDSMPVQDLCREAPDMLMRLG